MAGSRIKGITIEINGDATGLDKALKGTQKNISSTQRSLKDVNRLLKMDPSNTELLRQKQSMLNETIKETKEKLNMEKEALKQAGEQNVPTDKMQALKREVEATKQSLKEMEAQAKESASIMGNKFKEAGEKIKQTSDKISGSGKAITTRVTVPITAIGAASGKMAMDFEDAMAKVSTIADETEEPMDDLKKKIMNLSNQTGISSSEIAQNVYDAISAGQKTGDAVNFVSNSTKLAKAGFTDAEQSLDILTTIMNAYGMSADKVSSVSDMLIQTQNKGKTTVGELASTMGKIIPTANAYGVQLDQLCAGYANMTSNGIATAETTTYMNSMLNELGKSGTGVSNILQQKTGKSFKELMDGGASLADVLQIVKDGANESGKSFSDVWSSAEAGKAALTLLGDSTDGFNQTLNSMQSSTGATDKAFEKMQTTSTKISKAVNLLKNDAINLGSSLMETLAPIIEKVSKKTEQFTEWFNKLNDNQKETIVKIGLVVAATGPALAIIGKLGSGVGTIISVVGKTASAFGNFKSILTTNVIPTMSKTAFSIGSLNVPMIAVIAIVGAVIAIGVLLYKNWDKIKEKAGQLKDWLSEKWSNIKNSVVSSATEAKDKASAKFNELKENVSNKVSEIKNTASQKTQEMKDAISGKYNEIKNNVTGAWAEAKNGVSDTLSNMKTAYDQHGGGLKGAVSATMEGIKGIYETKFNAIDQLAGGKLSKIKESFDDKMAGARESVRGAIDKIKGFFNFSWSLPHLKMPHPSISGKFSLNPPSVPKFSISWYKEAYDKAMILKTPSIFGYSEKTGKLLGGGDGNGNEVVAGESHLINLIGKTVSSVVGERRETEEIHVVLENNIKIGDKTIYKDVAKKAIKIISDEQKGKRIAKGVMA